MIYDVNDDNYLIVAAKAYDKPEVLQSEFDEDIARLLYIKRLITKYQSTKQLKERLILNHLVIFYNVFGIETASKLLFLKLEPTDWVVIKPFLVFLSLLPETIQSVRGQTILTDGIGLDEGVIAALRGLK